MVEFVESQTGVILKYKSELQGNGWVWAELRTHGKVTISRAFHLEVQDLLTKPTTAEEKDLDSFTYNFHFGSKEGAYFLIEGRMLGIPNKVFIADIPISRKLFVAERQTSIFLGISRLLPPGQDIVIGGAMVGNIPVSVFNDLLDRFPNKGELDRYASARIATVLGDYFDAMKDARGLYEAYLNKTRSKNQSLTLAQSELFKTELEKYVFIRETITTWLDSSGARSENEWQKMIINFLQLIFPKYVAVLTNVKIEDSYSNPGKTTDRFIDIALVDASGNIDIIEVKKPFENVLISKGKYRDNYIPAKELSGSIMQAEKYLFHLSKWGVNGEARLNKVYGPHLPPGMTIRITNPKAMIILGRDQRVGGGMALDAAQIFDLEVIKRKYANMMDIMTYDDLLRRLDNIIAALRGKVVAST